MKKTSVVRLGINDIEHIVNEAVRRIINESYNGDLYHFTNLEGIYGILEDNCLNKVAMAEESPEDDGEEIVCLSRTGNPYIGYTPNTEYGLIFRITLDAEKMMSSIRNAKLQPWAKNNPRTAKMVYNGGSRFLSTSDYEERFRQDIYPLSKYCKSIDIFNCEKGQEFDKEQMTIINKFFSNFSDWKTYFGFISNGNKKEKIK